MDHIFDKIIINDIGIGVNYRLRYRLRPEIPSKVWEKFEKRVSKITLQDINKLSEDTRTVVLGGSRGIMIGGSNFEVLVSNTGIEIKIGKKPYPPIGFIEALMPKFMLPLSLDNELTESEDQFKQIKNAISTVNHVFQKIMLIIGTENELSLI